jgi:hypothetical protein
MPPAGFKLTIPRSKQPSFPLKKKKPLKCLRKQIFITSTILAQNSLSLA